MAILDCNAAAAARPPCQEDQLFYFTVRRRGVNVPAAGLDRFVLANVFGFSFSRAWQSWKFLRSTPSIRDSPFRPLPHTSEMQPHPLPEPCPLHRCGSM